LCCACSGHRTYSLRRFLALRPLLVSEMGRSLLSAPAQIPACAANPARCRRLPFDRPPALGRDPDTLNVDRQAIRSRDSRSRALVSVDQGRVIERPRLCPLNESGSLSPSSCRTRRMRSRRRWVKGGCAGRSTGTSAVPQVADDFVHRASRQKWAKSTRSSIAMQLPLAYESRRDWYCSGRRYFRSCCWTLPIALYSGPRLIEGTGVLNSENDFHCAASATSLSSAGRVSTNSIADQHRRGGRPSNTANPALSH
jgi:hypothetical protein